LNKNNNNNNNKHKKEGIFFFFLVFAQKENVLLSRSLSCVLSHSLTLSPARCSVYLNLLNEIHIYIPFYCWLYFFVIVVILVDVVTVVVVV